MVGYKKAQEELRDLHKKLQHFENDLDQTQESLMAANQRLQDKENALHNVCYIISTFLLFHLLLQTIWHVIWCFRLGTRLLEWQAKEEVEALEKKMQQLENELAQTQANLEQATHNLEEKEKALQNVRVS